METLSVNAALLIGFALVLCFGAGAMTCHLLYRRQTLPWQETHNATGEFANVLIDTLRTERHQHGHQQELVLNHLIATQQQIVALKVPNLQPTPIILPPSPMVERAGTAPVGGNGEPIEPEFQDSADV